MFERPHGAESDQASRNCRRLTIRKIWDVVLRYKLQKAICVVLRELQKAIYVVLRELRVPMPM